MSQWNHFSIVEICACQARVDFVLNEVYSQLCNKCVYTNGWVSMQCGWVATGSWPGPGYDSPTIRPDMGTKQRKGEVESFFHDDS